MIKKEDTSKRKAIVWTVLCLVFVCVIAFFLRGVLVYKAFPLNYVDEIKNYSGEYSIDEYLISAVIATESGFDATAESSSGAMGLMQIMPDTGVWAAQKIGIESFDVQMLNDPDVNIRIGCWYLNYLKDKYDGDAKKVLAAYNAGPSRVDDWVDNDGVLREIPFVETENYVVKVQRNYNIYKGLYDDF